MKLGLVDLGDFCGFLLSPEPRESEHFRQSVMSGGIPRCTMGEQSNSLGPTTIQADNLDYNGRHRTIDNGANSRRHRAADNWMVLLCYMNCQLKLNHNNNNNWTQNALFRVRKSRMEWAGKWFSGSGEDNQTLFAGCFLPHFIRGKENPNHLSDFFSCDICNSFFSSCNFFSWNIDRLNQGRYHDLW